MKVIGRIKELYKVDGLPSIYDLISTNALSNKADVLAYLNSGKVTATAPGSATDVLSGKRIKGSLKMYSDGEYAWRSDVIYYFDKYNLDLGNEFILHIISKTAK